MMTFTKINVIVNIALLKHHTALSRLLPVAMLRIPTRCISTQRVYKLQYTVITAHPKTARPVDAPVPALRPFINNQCNLQPLNLPVYSALCCCNLCGLPRQAVINDRQTACSFSIPPQRRHILLLRVAGTKLHSIVRKKIKS